MNVFLEEHKRLLQILIKHKVDFLVIGGYAVIIYGYERITKDIDLWLKPDNENKIKLINSLREFGIVEESLAVVETFNFEEPQVFIFGEEPLQVDFLTRISGIEFSDAIKQKTILSLEGREIPVIPFRHLIINKMLSGRPQDNADVEILQRINKYRKNPEPLD